MDEEYDHEDYEEVDHVDACIYGYCTMCRVEFKDDSEYAYRAKRYSSDGVHTRGMMFFCKSCLGEAEKKYHWGGILCISRIQ